MNIQSKLPTHPEEFLRWNEGREGKREFVKGRVVEMMINVTRNHLEITSNLMLALRQKLDRVDFSVGAAHFGVRTPDGIRYPDVIVDRKTAVASPEDHVAVEPVLVVEVLSSSSLARDFVEKLGECRELQPLLYYLILSHEEPRVWLSARGPDGWNALQEIFGLEGVIDLGRLDLQLSLADLYDGVAVRLRP